MQSQKIFTPRPHHGQQFCFRPPPPGISMGVLVIPPPPSQISVICQLGWVLWKEQFHQKCDKMRKNLTIHVNTVSNNLKDFLS